MDKEYFYKPCPAALVVSLLIFCTFSCENPEVHAGFVSPDDLYSSSEALIGEYRNEWATKAWKGEKVHTQILLWSNDSLKRIEVQALKLKGPDGPVPKKNIEINFIDYVWSNGAEVRKQRCGVEQGQDSLSVADVLEKSRYKNISAETLQPMWLTLDIPKDTPEGIYKGSISFNSERNQEFPTLNYSVDVVNRIIPGPEEWEYHFNLWQNPDAIARVHDVEKWSDSHLQAMKPYMLKLMQAGQKVITTTLIHNPWNSQTQDVYDSMIKWEKKRDGSWSYDYSVFDKYISFMLSFGEDKLIESFSMILWNLELHYYDEGLGKDTVLVAEPGSREYREHWKPMLTDLARHLKQKGWFDQTSIAMDERPMEAMQEAIEIIRATDKDFRISLAGSYHPEIEDELFDYSLALGDPIDANALAERKRKGLITTFYTSCLHEYPNTFTGSPPAEAAWLGWYAAKIRYDGFLRWAFNSWPEDPRQDSRFGSWPSGDTYIIYPGAPSSVRFERLIEGIEDYEKIRILKEEFQNGSQQEKLLALEEILEKFQVGALASIDAGEMIRDPRDGLNNL